MTSKEVPFNKKGIENLPNDETVPYRIETKGGRINYAGVAKRGRVQGRLAEHLPGDKDAVPGASVRIEQMPSIAEAKAKESRVIARSKPRHNQRGK